MPTLQIADADGRLIWSPPTTAAVESQAATTAKPHILIEVWGNMPWPDSAPKIPLEGLDPMCVMLAGIGGPKRESATDEMATFAKRCPDAAVTVEQSKADYTLRLESYPWAAALTGNEELTLFRYFLFDAKGTQIGVGPLDRSLVDAIDKACGKISTHWASENPAR
jgi:hypothetical protein